MAIHSLVASLSFDFQGKSYNLQSVVDIEKVITHTDFYQSIYQQLAQDNDIDLYSYQLEVMMDQEIHFSKPQGCTKSCINDGELNLVKLRKNYEQVSLEGAIQSIVQQHLDLNECSDNVKKALIKAYQVGRDSSRNSD